jgi:Uma2 family endonuclease
MFDDTNIAINPLAVLKSPKKPQLNTLEKYLRKEEKAIDLHEYYNGYIRKLPPANAPHNIISFNIGTTLHRALKDKYWVLMGKQLVYLPENNCAFYPDVVIIQDKPQYFDYDETLVINPVLIVEVLSNDINRLRRTVKFREYKTLASFKEHILIDKLKCHIQLSYRIERNKMYGELPTTMIYQVLSI